MTLTTKPGDSRPVTSNQRGPHPDLQRVVTRHLQTSWRQPMHRPTEQAFEKLEALLGDDLLGPVVLDSGCGNGESTLRLAERHQKALVIGVDQSAKRLARAASAPRRQGRVVWVRAELGGFWRLAATARWQVDHHYLLYPNPWPKRHHLRRRWHGHPVFRTLISLCPSLTLRTNWQIYAREFAQACELAGLAGVRLNALDGSGSEVSPFERKYRLSGHSLYEVSCEGRL